MNRHMNKPPSDSQTPVDPDEPARDKRFSARRKIEFVLRLLKGESLDALSREIGLTAAKLSQWRDEFLAAGEAGLKSRPAGEGLTEDQKNCPRSCVMPNPAAASDGYSGTTPLEASCRVPSTSRPICRSRRCASAVAPMSWSRHFQVIWMAAKGQTSAELVEATDYGRDWVFQIIRRYNQGGPDALSDARHEHPGGQMMLTDEQLQTLQARLQSPPEEGGLWTGPKGAAWMSRTLARPVHPQRGWEYLRRLGQTPQTPRPSSARADPVAQEAFKKGASQKR
jgi:transposase